MAETQADRLAGRSALAALAVVLAAALVVRLGTANYSFWADEIASLKFAELPLRQLWSDFMLRETNPPLFYSLLHGWTGLVGEDDGSVRLLPILIGCIGILAIYRLGADLGGPWTGVLAAALLAAADQHLYFSQQVRAYGLAQTSAIVAAWAALRYLTSAEGGRSWLAVYVAACTAALYAHTTLVVLPALLNLYVLPVLARHPGGRGALFRWVAANALVLVLWAWWGRITILQILNPVTISWIEPLSLASFGRALRNAYVPAGPPAVRIAAALGLGALFAFAAWRHWRQPASLCVLLAVGSPLLMAVLSLKTPLLLPRTLFWAQPFVLVTIALGLAALGARLRVPAILVALGLAVFGSLWALPSFEREPWAGIAALMRQQDPAATVIADRKITAFALQHYCRAPDCRWTIVTADMPETWEHDFPSPHPTLPSDLPSVLSGAGAAFSVEWGAPELRRLALEPILQRVGRSRDLDLPFALPTSMTVRHWRVPASDPSHATAPIQP